MRTKILIADDERDIVSMLSDFFESRGFCVLPAFSGAQALAQAEKQPDIILLDINMPGTDGLEVCRRIRDHLSCPILFLTARIEDADKVKGCAAGGDDYIVKPFSLTELEARVGAHLRREARHHAAALLFLFPLLLPITEANPLFRLVGLLPVYHVTAIALLSVEQMRSGLLYAVWAIPAALLFLVVGAALSRRAFAEHQVS